MVRNDDRFYLRASRRNGVHRASYQRTGPHTHQHLLAPPGSRRRDERRGNARPFRLPDRDDQPGRAIEDILWWTATAASV